MARPPHIGAVLDRRIARLERLIGRRMGARSGALALRVKRLRGALPDTVREDALALVRARHLSGHPRIARQLDARGLAARERRVTRWLRGTVLQERRVTARLRWLFGVLVSLTLMALLLAWLAHA